MSDNKPHVRLPTGSIADPALSSHGVDQARELAAHLAAAPGDAAGAGAGAGKSPAPPLAVERIYCSPYYRCLETVQPLVETMMKEEEEKKEKETEGRTKSKGSNRWAVRCEPGLVDWFGPAPVDHPRPLPTAQLRARFFPWVDAAYVASGVQPPRHGESMAQLHARLAAVMSGIVRQCDAEGVRSVLLCTHAAPILALGRVLTGQLPSDVGAEDFGVFTCGLSVFSRQKRPQQEQPPSSATTPVSWDDSLQTLAGQMWTHGRGIGGGWDCAVNCDCSFLSEGEERGWCVFPFPFPFPPFGLLLLANEHTTKQAIQCR